jgi:hypothetical protein
LCSFPTDNKDFSILVYVRKSDDSDTILTLNNFISFAVKQ